MNCEPELQYLIVIECVLLVGVGGGIVELRARVAVPKTCASTSRCRGRRSGCWGGCDGDGGVDSDADGVDGDGVGVGVGDVDGKVNKDKNEDTAKVSGRSTAKETVRTLGFSDFGCSWLGPCFWSFFACLWSLA